MTEYSHVCIVCQKEFTHKTEKIKTCSFHCRSIFIHVKNRDFKTTEEKFWNNTVKTSPNGCWEWKGKPNPKGYGAAYYNGKQIRAHRLSYLFTHKELPPDLSICHSCDNPICVNPAHLWAGTQKENMQDCVAKGRHPTKGRHPAKGGAPKGGKPRKPQRPKVFNYPRDLTNYAKKLTPQKVIEIRETHASGKYTYAQLGELFGVGNTAVGQIIRRQVWTWV